MSLQITNQIVSIADNKKPETGISGQDCSATNLDAKIVQIVAEPTNLHKEGFVMTSSRGHIYLPRLNENPIWQNARPTYKEIFLTLLFKCVFKETPFDAHGHVITLLPGQLGCTIRQIKSWCSTYISKNDVEASLRFFTTYQFLRQEVRHRKSIITILYSTFSDRNIFTGQTINQTKFRQDSDIKEKNLVREDSLHSSSYDEPESTPEPSKKQRNITCTPRRRPKDPLVFDWDSGEYKAITPKDMQDWAIAYPGINLTAEIAASVQWTKANTSRTASRTLWRKFLTSWLQKASERAQNRKVNAAIYGKSSAPDLLKGRFEHGKKYNGAECYISEKRIVFARGSNEHMAYFADAGFEQQLQNIMRKLEIKLP